eukprot:1834311-Rhodomonas_salina.1
MAQTKMNLNHLDDGNQDLWVFANVVEEPSNLTGKTLGVIQCAHVSRHTSRPSLTFRGCSQQQSVYKNGRRLGIPTWVPGVQQHRGSTLPLPLM